VLSAGLLLAANAPAFASDTDDRIESAAKKSYVFKTYLADDSIKTEARNGVVTLTGTVANDAHKSIAQDTVENLPGVIRVDNRLKVKDATPEEHSDTWISTKLRTSLLFHRSVSVTKTGIDVKDGVVTLTGEASSQAQKDLTTEYAKDIDHVKEVRNEMTVALQPAADNRTQGEKIDDASITAQVKASLLSHRSTSSIKTQIATVNGVVTVHGVAKNTAEKSLVTKLINDVKGVSGVVNEMTIAVPVAAN
jgi:osmotically-inducible protein OsmY